MIISALIDLMVTVFTSALMTGAGLTILRLFNRSEPVSWHIAEQIAYGFATGLSLWMTLLIPTMLKGLSPTGVTLFLITATIPAIVGFRTLSQVKSTVMEPTWVKSIKGCSLWLILLAVVWISPYFLHTLLPNTGWDAAELHLPLGKLFAARGNLFTHPVYYKFAITGGVQQVYGVFQYLGFPGAIIPFNFGAYLATLLLVFGWSHRHYGVRAAWLSTGVLASCSMLSELAIEPRIDGFLALFIGIAILSAADYLQTPDRPGYLYLSAFCLGAGLATKYTVIVLVGVIAFTLLIRLCQLKIAPVKPIILALVLISLPSVFWYARNLIQLNDPIYPYLIQRQYPDETGQNFDYPIVEKTKTYLKSLPDNHPVLQNARRQKSKISQTDVPSNALNLFDVIRHPEKYTRKKGLNLSPFLILILGLPFVRRKPVDTGLLVMAVSGYVILGVQSYLIRYLVLVFPACAAGAGAVLARVSRLRVMAYAGALAVILLCGLNTVRSYNHFYTTDAVSLLSGILTEEQWLKEVGYNNSRELPGAVYALNRYVADESIQSDDVLLMVGEGKGDRLSMHYIPDGSWNGHIWQYLWLISDHDPEKLLKVLHRMDVTHILYNPTLFQWVIRSTSSHVDSVSFTQITVMEFIEHYCTPIYNTRGIVVGQINYPAAVKSGGSVTLPGRNDDDTIPNPSIPYIY